MRDFNRAQPVPKYFLPLDTFRCLDLALDTLILLTGPEGTCGKYAKLEVFGRFQNCYANSLFCDFVKCLPGSGLLVAAAGQISTDGRAASGPGQA